LKEGARGPSDLTAPFHFQPRSAMPLPLERYNNVAILLHWLMAVAFLLMLASGFTMAYIDIPKDLKFSMFQWHKSLGLILLIAFFVRVAWRLASAVPPLPAAIPSWEARAAKAGHWALYFCMLAMPLSGWTLVSSSVLGLPTYIFGWFEWPHIPGISANKAVNDIAGGVHWTLAILFTLAIAGHIAAVVKHAAIDRVNLLPRMWWGKGKISA
jgi:cytochrome b561